MKYDDMVEPVATGLLRAYKDYPKDLRTTLNRWFEECRENNSKLNRRKKLTHRDKVLVTMLELYGKLNFEGPNQVISLEEVYQKLTILSKAEQRSNVRDAIFKTMGKLMRWNWALWESQVPIIWSNHNFKDAVPLVDSLVSVFLDARKNLTGATYYFQWREEAYPIWIDMYERPKTIIEMKLGNWMSSDNESHKKLGLLSFLKIAKTFEMDEREYISVLKLELWNKQHMMNPPAPVTQQTAQPKALTFELSFFTQIKIFFLLFFRSKSDKGTLKTLLITLYQYRHLNRNYRKHLRVVLQKWAMTESSSLQKLSRWLRRLF
jgi:hypothetical protein